MPGSAPHARQTSTISGKPSSPRASSGSTAIDGRQQARRRPIMIEVQELKQHVRWLEDQVSRADRVSEDIESIKDGMASMVEAIQELASAVLKLTDTLKTAAPRPRKPRPNGR